MQKAMALLILMLSIGYLLSSTFVAGSYTMEGEEYGIILINDESVGIGVGGSDLFAQSPAMLITSANLELVRESLIRICDKYVKWDKAARDNKITSHTVSMGDTMFTAGVEFGWSFGDEFHYSGFRGDIYPEPIFKVQDGKATLIIKIRKQVSLENQFVTWSPDYIMRFTNEKELRVLIEQIDPVRLKNLLLDQERKDSVFE